jgi:hypothetical protein
MAAPMIMGSALSWNALRRPNASATEPLNRQPMKAPPKHMLTTSPAHTQKEGEFLRVNWLPKKDKPSDLQRDYAVVPSASVFPAKPRSVEMLSSGSFTTLKHDKTRLTTGWEELKKAVGTSRAEETWEERGREHAPGVVSEEE